MLLEDQGKRLFRAHGIRVPEGRTIATAEQVPEAAGPVMVKALIPAGGRGKGGGVRRASGTAEARAAASALLGARVSGHTVRSVLVEEAVTVSREMYLSVSIDRSLGLPIIIASGSGGVDIELVGGPAFHRWTVHPFLGIREFHVRELTAALKLEGRESAVGDLLRSLWAVFTSLDCELVEVNPLILAADGELVAADAKVVINDDSLFRHPDLELPEPDGDGIEAAARSEGIVFVPLDGDIGVIANGAGLTMATMDALSAHGGRTGAFMDLGGTDDPARVRRAFELMAASGQKVVLINIFGAMTKCDTVAQGLLDALGGLDRSPATVVRLRGANEERAREMLLAKGIVAFPELEDAVREAVDRGAGK